MYTTEKKTNKKQSELKFALKNFIKCAELYSKTLGIDIEDTIYSYASEEGIKDILEEARESEEESDESGFDYKSQLAEATKFITK